MSFHKFAIAALVPLGIYTLHGITQSNGLFPSLTKATAEKVLTDSNISWPTWLQQAPGLAGVLVGFFWPLVQGSHVAGSLHSLAFSGNSVSMWLVTMLEAGRGGTRGRLISYITLYGILFQLGGIGVIGPAYLALSLYLSPTPSNPNASNIAIPDLTYLRSVPYGLITGFIIPTLILTLPYPSLLSLDTKIATLLFWQAFPIWTSLSTSIYQKTLFSKPKLLDIPSTPQLQLPLLRRAYTLAILISAASHISVLTLSLSTLIAPTIFSLDPATLASLSPSNLFLPTFSTAPVASVGEGALKFLQWDYAIASASQILWAVAQTRKVERKRLGFSLGSVWVDVVVRSVVLGPLASALTIVWERDEVVLGEVWGNEGGKRKG